MLQTEETAVQSSDRSLTQRKKQYTGWFFDRGALTSVGACLLLAALLLGLFSLTTSNQYDFRPGGDASYFTEMTQVFYLNEPPIFHYPTMHSRRILGPWLAGMICSASDAVTGVKAPKPFHYSYNGVDHSRTPKTEHRQTYERIMSAWQVLNATSFVAIFLGLFGILRVFQMKQAAAEWQPIWGAMVLCCSPVLGRIYFNWPMMNDLVGISLAVLSLLCALKGRTLLSGLLFGAGMLARENLLFIYPCFLWIILQRQTTPEELAQRKKFFLTHLILSFAPYILVCAFPIFQNVGPLLDRASGIRETSAGAAHDYLSLILFHLHRPFTADHALLRQLLVYWHVLGPLFLLTLRFYPWKRAQLTQDGWLWAAFGLALASAFYVDRYVVYAVLPLVLLARHSLGNRLSPWMAICLLFFYVQAVQLGGECDIGDALQVETTHWPNLLRSGLCCAAAVVLIFIEPLLRNSLSFREKGCLQPLAA